MGAGTSPVPPNALLGHGLSGLPRITFSGSVKSVKSVAEFLQQNFYNKGRLKLQFEVKGQEYFLAFVEDEKRWFLFSPRTHGMLRLPVYVDAVTFEGLQRPSLHLAS